MKTSQREAVASLLDFEQDKRDNGESRGSGRHMHRSALESSGEINRWDRGSLTGELIKRLSYNEIRIQDTTLPLSQSIPKHFYQRKARSSRPRPQLVVSTAKSYSLRINSPVHSPALPIHGGNSKQSTPRGMNLRDRVKSFGLRAHPVAINLPVEDVDCSTSFTVPNTSLDKQDQRKALFQRVLLRPRSIENYEREKSKQILRKSSMCTPKLVPNCFRNYKAKMPDALISPLPLNELLKRHYWM